MKIFFTLLFSLFLLGCNLLQTKETGAADFSNENGFPIDSFIPKGFSILDSASGNLNLDPYPDKIVILKSNGEETSGDICRPLLLLTGQQNNGYKLEARNDSVVLCANCGGISGDPYQSITITNGIFSIEHYGGSNWRWTRVITFRYAKETNKWYLHNDSGISFHTSDPDSTTNIVTNENDFGNLLFENYSNQKGLQE